MTVNMNDRVWVKLTPPGYETLRRYYADLGLEQSKHVAVREANAADDGRLPFQLWELMQIFGPAIGMASPVPFEDNSIEFENDGYQ